MASGRGIGRRGRPPDRPCQLAEHWPQRARLPGRVASVATSASCVLRPHALRLAVTSRRAGCHHHGARRSIAAPDRRACEWRPGQDRDCPARQHAVEHGGNEQPGTCDDDAPIPCVTCDATKTLVIRMAFSRSGRSIPLWMYPTSTAGDPPRVLRALEHRPDVGSHRARVTLPGLLLAYSITSTCPLPRGPFVS